MAPLAPIHGRLAELLADEAAGAHDPSLEAELDRALSQDAVSDRDQMMRAASLAQLAFLKGDTASHATMPASVRSKLQRQADAWAAGRNAAAPAPIGDPDLARHPPRR